MKIIVETSKTGLKEIIENFTFYLIHKETDEILSNPDIIESINQSKALIIDYYCDQNHKCKYIYICFKDTIIIFKPSLILSQKNFFEIIFNKKELPIYFLSKSKDFLTQEINIKIINPVKTDPNLEDEIDNFQKEIIVKRQPPELQLYQLSKAISCIAGYLICESYAKINEKQNNIYKNLETLGDFVNTDKEKSICIQNCDIDSYIELRNLGFGSLFVVVLIYHISRREIRAIKKVNSCDKEITKLINREKNNLSMLNHPLIPSFYGEAKDDHYIIMQFINGQTLENIEELQLSIQEKLIIIFEIIKTIQYVHENKFIYRDLKPNNVIIDENKTAFIIDFDRMVKSKVESEDIEYTKDFSPVFVAPEIFTNNVTYENDIYSIGKMLFYILKEEILRNRKINKNLEINHLYEKCIDTNISKRPTISELMLELFIIYNNQINKSSIIKNFHEIQYFQGLIDFKFEYIEQDISNAIKYLTIASDLNLPEAQYNLGLIYCMEKYNTRDINKAFHYFTLAADNNHLKAQYQVGFMYYDGSYIIQDINKAIYYFTLAAIQNDPKSQNFLGEIYSNGKYIKPDIKKAFHFFELAAEQNYADSQYNLGYIYYKGEYVKRDYDKSIEYLSLAANQNHLGAKFFLPNIIYFKEQSENNFFNFILKENSPQSHLALGFFYLLGKYTNQDIDKGIYHFTIAADLNIVSAQFILGFFYLEGQYVRQDIDKAIHFFSLASNENFLSAHCVLGNIYYEGKYVKKEINKAIKYYLLASKQNSEDAQCILGSIYYNGDYIVRDIDKSIYYLSLAADQNNAIAQHNLGLIYYEGKYVKREINKAIYYLMKSANQNFPQAQVLLGHIYEEGKYVKREISKSMYYYLLAASLKNSDALYKLGVIYFKNELVPRDTNKMVHYFTLAANFGNSIAQFFMGLIYATGKLVKKDIIRGIDFIMQSSSNGNIDAHFALGYFYQEGKYINKDIKKSIYYYKEASSFNNQYAKNNLGVLYKHGYGNDIPKNINFAMIYFDEAIKDHNDEVSMYNLAHLYIYENKSNEEIDKGIKLLIKSFFNSSIPSQELLLIALLKKHGFSIKNIFDDVKKMAGQQSIIPFIIKSFLQGKKFADKSSFDHIYLKYKEIDFMYNFMHTIIPSINMNEKDNKYQYPVNTTYYITQDFYEGFGKDILENE